MSANKGRTFSSGGHTIRGNPKYPLSFSFSNAKMLEIHRLWILCPKKRKKNYIFCSKKCNMN